MVIDRRLTRAVGVAGTVLCLAVFIHEPSWPTPDKLLVFITVLFMAFGQGWYVFKRMAPFVALLLVYESFRGLAHSLNDHVNFGFMPAADRVLTFGHLPTAVLQHWWWHGSVQWYDFVFYLAYMLHFVLPFALALVILFKKEAQYWRYVTTFLTVSFGGFLTFLLFPAAPPWMASERGLIQPITRISSHVWYALGIHDFPSVYNRISPNPVAAMPSLHAAYSTLVALFVTKLFSSRWRYLAWLYPILIWTGTIYQGEHYLIDAVVGVAYALIGYALRDRILQWVRRAWQLSARAMKRTFPRRTRSARLTK